MQQASDTFTRDMFPTPPSAVRFRFYIETPDGEEIEWCGLTRKQARDMYAYTDAHQPSNAVRYGWEEMK